MFAGPEFGEPSEKPEGERVMLRKTNESGSDAEAGFILNRVEVGMWGTID